jgi:hypothetical protein
MVSKSLRATTAVGPPRDAEAARTSDRWRTLAYVLFGVHALLIILTFRDYGITFDEDWHYSYGDRIINWYSSGFRDPGALEYWTLVNYGGFFITLVRLVTLVSPIGPFETAHLINAFFGFGAVIGVWKLGKLIAGSPVGFLAAIMLVLTPRFYGHSFNNPVDIPLATLFVFALYYLIQVLRSMPNPPRGLIVKLGLAIGLALGIRVGATILVVYFVLGIVLYLAGHWLRRANSTHGARDVRSVLLGSARTFLAICSIAYVVMLVWWPAAQVSPIRHPLRTLRHMTGFLYEFPVFFEGHFISNTELPWYYVPKWFLVVLPEFYFVALGAGLPALAMAIAGALRSRNVNAGDLLQQHLGMLVLIIAVIMPVLYVVLTTPLGYDEIRHYLFVVPPLAVIAAISLGHAVRHFRASLVAWAAVVVVSASKGLTLFDMGELHPHQYVYFNRLFGGGVAEAAKSFELDYWGNSYREGVQWLVQNYPSKKDGERVTVASCSYSLSTSYFLPPDRFEYVGSLEKGQIMPEHVTPDVLLATPRWDCDKKLAGDVIHVVARQGAPLLTIVEVSPLE